MILGSDFFSVGEILIPRENSAFLSVVITRRIKDEITWRKPEEGSGRCTGLDVSVATVQPTRAAHGQGRAGSAR